MLVLGVNCTKAAIYAAQTKWVGTQFKVQVPWAPIALALDDPNQILDIYRGVKPVLQAASDAGVTRVIVLACGSGKFRSANETVKAEGIVELVAAELGLSIEHVTPQSLKKALGCSSKEHWQDRSVTLFNPSGAIQQWSAGVNGAVAAAYKATKP